MKNVNNILVVLLSGGSSSRMGKHKAFLICEGQYMVYRLSDIYRNTGIKKIICVLNHKIFNGEWESEVSLLSREITVIKNEFPEMGRTFSIRLALDQVNNNEPCFFQNIDNPYVTPELLKKMIDSYDPDGYVVASYNGLGGHPVLLGTNVITYLKSLKTNDWIMKDVLKMFKKTNVEANSDKVLLNLNTEKDLSRFFN